MDVSPEPIAAEKSIYQDIELLGGSPPLPRVAHSIDLSVATLDTARHAGNAGRLVKISEQADKGDYVSRVIAPLAGALSFVKAHQLGRARYTADQTLSVLRNENVPPQLRVLAASRICEVATAFADLADPQNSIPMLEQAHLQTSRIPSDALRSIAGSRLFRGSAEFAVASFNEGNVPAVNRAIEFITAPHRDDLDQSQVAIAEGAFACCQLAESIFSVQPEAAIMFLENVLSRPLQYPVAVVFTHEHSTPYLALALLYEKAGRLEDAQALMTSWVGNYEYLADQYPSVFTKHLSYLAQLRRKLGQDSEAGDALASGVLTAAMYEDAGSDERMRGLEIASAADAIEACRFETADRYLFEAAGREGTPAFQYVPMQLYRAVVAKRFGLIDMALGIYRDTSDALKQVISKESGPDTPLTFLKESRVVLVSERARGLIKVGKVEQAKAQLRLAGHIFDKLPETNEEKMGEAQYALCKASIEMEISQKNYPGAQRELDTALKHIDQLHPSEASFLQRKQGIIFTAQERFEEAEAAFQKASEILQTNNQLVSVEMYRLCLDRSNLEKAQEEHSKAYELILAAEKVEEQIQQRNGAKVHLD